MTSFVKRCLKNIVAGATLVMMIAFALTSSTANATPAEAKFLRKVAEQYILAQFQNSDPSTKVQVTAGRIDDRRDYGGKCEGYLTAELRGTEIKATSQVKITCSQPNNSYSIYVPVKVTMLTQAIVASRNLTRNTVISPADLKTIYIEDTSNQTAAVSDPNILVGSRLKRDVKAGDQIRVGTFCVVCKNDKVNIVANSRGLSLKTVGLALDDGGMNESIRVKNLKSQKTISAVVSAPGQVDVIF